MDKQHTSWVSFTLFQQSVRDVMETNIDIKQVLVGIRLYQWDKENIFLLFMFFMVLKADPFIYYLNGLLMEMDSEWFMPGLFI